MLLRFIIIAPLLCLSVAATAQDRLSVGLHGAYGLNSHDADFRAFPGIPNCCPAFESGTGAGPTFAVLARLPVAPLLRGEVRLGYTALDGVLTRQEATTVSGNVPGIFEHTVDAQLRAITLEPLVAYNVFSGLHVFAGGRIGLLSTATFDQREELVQPATGTFPNGARVQNEVVAAAIPNASSLNAAIVAGLQYDLPMNASKSLLLVPEVSYAYGLTSVVSNISWNVNQLRLGASVVWLLGGTEKPSAPVERIQPEELRQPDTTTIAATPADVPQEPRRASLTASIAAAGVNPDGTEQPSFVVNVEEFSSTMMTPLLGYVFFAEGQSALPTRYVRLQASQTASFREEAVSSFDKLPTYYHLLNIVGSRIRQAPDAKITLVGCNANVGAEAGNLALSSARAQEVQRYLVDVWGLDASRIQVQQRNLPERAANAETSDGQQENRRVEIVSDRLALLAPVIARDTVRSISPPSIRLRPNVNAERPVAEWNVTLRQGQTTLKTFRGSGAVPAVVDWNVQQDEGSHPRTDSPIFYQLDVVDVDGNRTEARGQLDAKLLTVSTKRTERIADKEIDRFSLILFDVRSAEIGAANAAIVDLIKPYIRPTSSVTLLGLTDRLGDAAQNQVLAEQRARSAARALGIQQRATVRGIGNATSYAPDLPEGRLYTRTVDITIETPVAP